MKKNKFPKGWDEERVKRVLAHYEKQSEEEAVAEDEAVQPAPAMLARHRLAGYTHLHSAVTKVK